MAHDTDIPIANPEDFDRDKKLFQFQFGAYGDIRVYVWADHDEDAFEIAVEWADDNAPGVFVSLGEGDLREAADDLGIRWDSSWPDWDDPKFNKVVEHAEADLTSIGHTTLNSGAYIPSWEWHFVEVTDRQEIKRVAVDSFEEDSDLLEVSYAQEGPDENEPTSGLRVGLMYNGLLEITEWTDMYHATGEPDLEDKILRVDSIVSLQQLLDPKAKHRELYSRDKRSVDLGDVLLMPRQEQEDAVVAAALSWIGHYGGEESYVRYIGDGGSSPSSRRGARFVIQGT